MCSATCPKDEEWRSPNIYEDTPAGRASWKKGEFGKTASLPEHDVWFFYLQRICNHCTYPGCLAACPRSAIYKRPEDGVVLIDQSRCRGYRKCVEACPYKKSMYRPTTRVSEKCIACYPRLEGRDAEITPDGRADRDPLHERLCGQDPAAGNGQTPRARRNLDRGPRQPTVLSHSRRSRSALPLYPQFGTEPNGYYIPPRWVPRPYLEQMFGPWCRTGHRALRMSRREDCSRCCSCSAPHGRFSSRFEVIEGPKRSTNARSPCLRDRRRRSRSSTTPSLATTAQDRRRWFALTVEEPTFETSPLNT